MSYRNASASSSRSPLHYVCGGMLTLFVLLILGLVAANVGYLFSSSFGPGDILDLLTRDQMLFAIRMSLATSLTTLILVLVTGIPIGYALSRYRFPLRAFCDTLVDVPIVLPPVVTGISLLAFFNFGFGQFIRTAMESANLSTVSGAGIVMCQYLVAVPYCIRSAKAAFNGVDPNLEQVSRVLGCTTWQTFYRVSAPLARNGLIAGGVMAWARALGIFAPIMVFVGTGPRVLTMPTTLWLELSTGNIATAVAIALVMLALAGVSLVLVHWLAPEGNIV
ncbi:MAG: ABC transporter permease subunit [Planctomycetaceae bacterium]|nr:ABC transporter permease subunit [Planctomycetaceae bacterium]